MINILFIVNDAPVEPGRSLNGLRLASSMSMHAGAYVRVFLLGAAAACACRRPGLREREEGAALLASVIRHGGEVKVCERCGDEQAVAAGELLPGAALASLAELSGWVTEADRLLVF